MLVIPILPGGIYHKYITNIVIYQDILQCHFDLYFKLLLYFRTWISNERPGLMFDFATAWLIQHKVLLSGAIRYPG